MKHGVTHRGLSGFALIEALTALLLLALATIGSGTAMINALAGQRAALLRTEAADLAADLAEALRAAPDTASRETEIQAWHGAVMRRLPQVQSQALRRPSGFDIQLNWRDARVSTQSGLTLTLSLGPALEGS